MKSPIEIGLSDMEKFGQSLSLAARDYVKWELRKLQWVTEEASKARRESEAA
jgi:hypothetical protein